MKNRDDFALYVIYVGETGKTVKKQMSDKSWTFSALLDTQKTVAAMYGINSHPRTFLIDKKGDVAAVAFGFRKWNAQIAVKLINRLLTE
jgi:peroxiredoxin